MLGSKVSQFIKKRYVVPQEGANYVSTKDSVQEPVRDVGIAVEPVLEEAIELDQEWLDYEKSNLGRTFGWWVCIDGQRVATLEYRCLLEEPVHLYSVNVLDDKFLKIDLDSEKWRNPSVTLQSRYAENYIKQGLSMAAVGQKMIVVEDLIIPEDHFRRQHKKLEAFHIKLVEKAKSKSKT